MGSIVRGKINRGDLALYDGKNMTTTRVDATSGTITGLQINDYVDVLQVFGDGTARTVGTIDAAISYIGSNNATLVFSPGTWTIDSDITIPSNLTVVMASGAVFDVSAGKTITISGSMILQSETFSSGSGTVTVSKGGASLVYIEDSASLFTSTNVEGALVEAIASNFDTTLAEGDASVTPTNKSYPPTYIERYGGVADGTTNSTSALETSQSIGRQTTRFWETGRTQTLDTYTGAHRFYIIRDAFLDRGGLQGPANITSDGTQTTSTLRLGQDPDTSNGAQWRKRKISEISFSGKTRTDVCITFGDDGAVKNELAGNWHIENCQFERHDIAVKKEHGNIGNYFDNCNAQSGNFFYHATAITPYHAGADHFEHCWTSGFRKAAYFIDGDQVDGAGGFTLDDCFVEQNPGFGVFIKDWNGGRNAIHLRGVWFEANAAAADGYAGTVDLGDGGGARTPRDIYLENVDMAYIEKCQFLDIEIIDSNVIFDGYSFVHAGAEFIDNSTGTGRYAIARNCYLTNFGDEDAPQLMIESITRQTTTTGATNRHWWIPHRTNVIVNPPRTGTYEGGDTFENGEALIDNTGAGANNRSATIVAGCTFPTASRYALDVNSNQWQVGATASAASVTSGKWLVVTAEIKLVSGELSQIAWGAGATWTSNDGETLVNDNVGEWRTIGWVAEAADTGVCRMFLSVDASNTAVVDLGLQQIIQFDSAQEAYDYFNARTACVGLPAKLPQYPTASLPSVNSLQPGLVAYDTTTDGLKLDQGSAWDIIPSGVVQSNIAEYTLTTTQTAAGSWDTNEIDMLNAVKADLEALKVNQDALIVLVEAFKMAPTS